MALNGGPSNRTCCLSGVKLRDPCQHKIQKQFPLEILSHIWLLLREIRPHDKEGCVKTVNKKPEKSQPPRLDNIAVSLFVVILVEFDKY